KAVRFRALSLVMRMASPSKLVHVVWSFHRHRHVAGRCTARAGQNPELYPPPGGLPRPGNTRVKTSARDASSRGCGAEPGVRVAVPAPAELRAPLGDPHGGHALVGARARAHDGPAAVRAQPVG